MRAFLPQPGLGSSIKKLLFTVPRSTFSLFLCSSTKNDPIFLELPISETYVSYLENCPDLISLKKLHACVVTSGLGDHIFLGSKLLNKYASFNSLPESRSVFEKIHNKNISLWNSALVGYFRAGFLDEVLCLYLRLKQLNIGVNSSTVTFCLKCCTKLEFFKLGKEIHVDAFKFGVSADRFVGSSLIGLYSKYEDIEVARKVFDEIHDKDLIAYTSMITGYAQLASNQAYEAFKIVREMQEKGFEPNRVTLVSLLQVATCLHALEEGRSIHGYAIRREIGSSEEFLNTCLIDMYVKCGIPHAADSIFVRMGTKSLACWNAVISSHVQTGRPSIALDCFCLMVRKDIKPDLITLSNALLSCAELELLIQGKGIHAYIICSGIKLDLVAATALIDMYFKCQSIEQARELFNALKSRDTILCNVMIAGYVGCRLPKKALEIFLGMVAEDIRLNTATFLSILSASAQLLDVRVGRSIHGHVVRKVLDSNTEIANQILHMYTKCGYVDIGRQVFSRIRNKDLVSWTSMMLGYVQHGHADETLQLFQLMQEARMEPDLVTLISLLQALSQLGCSNLAKEIHGYMYRVELEKEIHVINSLMTTYAKCGRLDMAKLLFEHTRGRGLTSWNAMISAFGMHGECVEALELFNQMQEANVKPDELTFTSLISACSHAGMVEEGQKVFHAMTVEHSIIPHEEHYGSMVDLYARAGRLEEAYDLVKHLSLKQSSTALVSLLAACRVHNDTKMAVIVGKKLFDLEPNNSGAYTLLSNIFAEAGEWDEATKLREEVMSRSVRKQPGYSMVELDKQACQM